MTKSSSSDGNDERKTKAQLIAELAGVRQRVIGLEAAEIERPLFVLHLTGQPDLPTKLYMQRANR